MVILCKFTHGDASPHPPPPRRPSPCPFPPRAPPGHGLAPLREGERVPRTSQPVAPLRRLAPHCGRHVPGHGSGRASSRSASTAGQLPAAAGATLPPPSAAAVPLPSASAGAIWHMIGARGGSTVEQSSNLHTEHVYEITVRGEINVSWLAGFGQGDVQIEHIAGGGHHFTRSTIVTAGRPDPAAARVGSSVSLRTADARGG